MRGCDRRLLSGGVDAEWKGDTLALRRNGTRLDFRVVLGTLRARQATFVACLVHNNTFVKGQYSLRCLPHVRVKCAWGGRTEAATYDQQASGMVSTYRCTSGVRTTLILAWRSTMEEVGRMDVVFSPSQTRRTPLATCTAPVYTPPRQADLIAWMQFPRDVLRVLYVRSEVLSEYGRLLQGRVEQGRVVLVDAGRVEDLGRGLTFRDRTEAYDEKDRRLHYQYHDQVLWLNHCKFRYGPSADLVLNLDLDEVLVGDVYSATRHASRPAFRVQTLAFGHPSGSSSCRDRPLNTSFVDYFRLRQARPISSGWRRTKLLYRPNRTRFSWMHDVFSWKDACGRASTLPFESAHIHHYVDAGAATRIHGGVCRCDSIDASLPCLHQ